MNFSFNQLKVGSLVEIEILGQNQEMTRLKTIVEDIVDESLLKLFAPIQKGKNYPLRIGDGFNLITVFKYPTVDKYDILSCRCKIIDREKDGNISTISIQKTGKFQQVQRRNYFRLPLIKNITLVQDDKKYEILSKDLSGNGIKGYISKKLSADTEAILLLDVETKVLELRTKIIECSPDPNHSYRYEIRGSFVNIKNSQLSELLKYIFLKQSESIKKQIDFKDYASILDTEQSYSDFFSMSNLEKLIRISPILLWVMTLLEYTYFVNTFRNKNMGINFFFGQFQRSYYPEHLMTANTLAIIILALCTFSFFVNNFLNKKRKIIINIQYLIQVILALIVVIVYQTMI